MNRQADAPQAAEPLQFWLTDRSRWKTSLSRCLRARYLNSHYGPTGYGITTRGESIPLATGRYTHLGLERQLRLLKDQERLPSLDEQRQIVHDVVEEYQASCASRGFQSGGILSSAQTDELITEQSCLIAGLLWMLRTKFLPWFHEQFRVVEIEQERLHLLSCTCQTPLAAPVMLHQRKGCTGRALMIRTDLLAQRRTGRGLAYFEGKTTGWDSQAWEEQWETDPQLALGTLGLPEKYGQEVTELYVIRMSKGPRRKDKYEELEAMAEGRPTPRRQISPLCYGWRRPANPPLTPEDWLWSYQWEDEAGQTRRASRAHKRTGVWELMESDWPAWRAQKAQDPDISPAEFWARSLPDTLANKVVGLLGPYNRQDAQLEAVLRGMDALEAGMHQAAWHIYELQEQGAAWASTEVQEALDRDFPQSWACRPFGKEHQCEYVPICHRDSGWQEPLRGGRFVPRLPHHQPERDQAVARGLIAAEAFEDEGEE